MVTFIDDPRRELELDAFPVMDDFSVDLTEERMIVFNSTENGLLAGFPAWEDADRDLRHYVAEDIPLGPIEAPYEDRDEGWRIVVFEHAGSVYVLEGDDPNATEFEVFFRVPLDLYYRSWMELIERFHAAVPLDPQGEDGLEE